MLRPTLLIPLLPAAPFALAQETAWETIQLDAGFYCEGACFGDFDGDGEADVASGPFWYAGPDFRTRHRIYEGEPFDPAGYSDNFFAWARDLDGDGWQDLFVIGFPGKEAWWFKNPGGGDELWPRYLVQDKVDNESPDFVDVNGDGLEDLLCNADGKLCWFERVPDDPTARWIQHDVTGDIGAKAFSHGLGAGDLDGDGRGDLLMKQGWWRQPASLEGDPLWEHHPYPFGRGYGGAQMLVYDVDGDGDGDVVSSLEAHRFGLSWFENVIDRGEGEPFVEHPVMGSEPGEFGSPLAVSELHALALADVDGDGLTDVVTGKRYRSHNFREEGSRDPPYLFWLRLERDDEGARFSVQVVHDDSGVGTQVVATDANGDGLVDMVVGNKHGTFVHLQRALDVPGARALAPPKLPPPLKDRRFPPGGVIPVGEDGDPLNLDFETGDLSDWTAEGNAFEGQPIRGDPVRVRRDDMDALPAGDFWVGGYELHGDGRTGTLTSEPFTLELPWAAFLLAGGGHDSTRVDLVAAEDGARLMSATGRNHEELRPVVLDLSAHLGEWVRLRIVDEHRGGWGHVNFDHFRLYAERPSFPAGLEVPSLLDVRAHAGLTPERAAEAMSVPEGFRVDLIAGEPDLHQPIALTIDERGRIWVAEAHSYPVKRAPEPGTDQILIFEDADADGTFESRKVFIEGLDLVSGFEVGHGGVWVGQAPELLFIPDADGDDVPDGPPEVVLDGWGYQDTHETLNAFNWGPDGWLYGCHGVFTHSKVGPPGTPDEERERINAGVWRLHPVTREFEVFAWGTSNPWGVDFDDHGQAFATACVIPHLFHMVQGGRFHRQAGAHFNPYVYDDIKTVADHLHWVGDTPHSGNRRSDSVGGGHAHCGALIYLADSWPERYRNTLFVNNVHGNCINNERLEPSRSGYVGRHEDDFLVANDLWFRGINMRCGPDGSVYMIDWYDEQACHLTNPEIWDRTNGRLFRVSYGEPAPLRVDLGALKERELIELCLHPNDWYVRTARRLLAERGLSKRGRSRLVEILETHPEVPRRLRALWALHGAGRTDGDLLLDLLASTHPHLRSWAIQLACEGGAPERRFLAQMEQLAASDPSPVVRLHLTSALQRLPLEQRWEIARGLLAHGEDADDPNLPCMIWYGIEPLVPERPAAALALARSAQIPSAVGWIHRRAAADDGAREELMRVLAEATGDAERRSILEQTLRALGKRRGVAMPAAWPAAYAAIRRDGDGGARERAVVLAAIYGDAAAFPELRSKLADRGGDREERELALDALVRGKDRTAVPAICALLEEDALRAKALKALASFDHPDVPAAILGAWPRLDEGQRRDAIATLTSRSAGALALMDALEEERVPRTLLTAFELRKLAAFGDPALDARVAEVWGAVRSIGGDAQEEIERWQGILGDQALTAADLPFGRDVYSRTCERCHTLYGVGEEIGPDLTGGNRFDVEFVLQNVIDPNAVIPNEYQVTIVLTDDGRIVTGIAMEENEETLTLQTENEILILGHEEIEARKLDENSMMPQGQLDTLSEEEVIALIAYLRHDQQVPRRMTAENVAELFDGETLAGWRGDESLWSVEEGTIVGASPGIGENAFLVSDFDLGDFRLIVDVHLTPPEGNSGIQFRSHARDDGSGAGYQADIGAGWWGTLYDEHGRGSLVGGEQVDAVHPGEWNSYEIVAVGNRVLTALNGVPCVDYTDGEQRPRGVLALQLHSGGPFEVRFRDLRLELDPEAHLVTVTDSR